MNGNSEQRGAWLILALLVIAMPALADGDRDRVDPGPVDRAAVNVFGGGIDLAPLVSYERAVVTVSGVGRAFRLEFDADTVPSIQPFAPNGDLLADGVYRWQLDLVPDATTARQLRESAAAHGGRAQRPWTAQSGSFAVRGGAIAMPGVTEAGALERLRRDEAARGTRAGAVIVPQKARPAALDADEQAFVGAEKAGLAAGGPAPGREAGPAASAGSSAIEIDSDRQAIALGASPEPVWVPLPRAHEINQLHTTPRSDGSNGRPRSDR